MSQIIAPAVIEYPETDGESMGETALHYLWMSYIHNVLSYRYRGQRVQVACDLLVYFCEGDSKKFVIPDNLVALDCDPELLRVFLTWEQGKAPDVAFEVLSCGTGEYDATLKPLKFAEIGFKELFLFDPEGEHISPRLQGFRLDRGQLVPIEPDRNGALLCERLGILLSLDGGKLVMHDVKTGQRLLTEAEAEHAARDAAEARAAKEAHSRKLADARAAEEARARKTAEDQAAKEAQVRKNAEARAAEEAQARKTAEVELERLREQLRRRTGGDGI